MQFLHLLIFLINARQVKHPFLLITFRNQTIHETYQGENPYKKRLFMVGKNLKFN